MSVEVNKYLKEIALDMKKANLSPILIKKIYVLAALELERYKAQINEQISEEMLINDNVNIEDEIAKKIKEKINIDGKIINLLQNKIYLNDKKRKK